MRIPKLHLRCHSTISTQHLFTKKPQPSLPITDEISTNQLLQDLGFINQPNSGLIHWLPLGLRVLKKIESIIRYRMDEINGEEFQLSSISSEKLWSKTSRWENKELFKLKINSQNFCLTPTHEEEITELIKNINGNYKNLPILSYQITNKYRFEKRPRGGLLRSREFIMKDAYSFDADKESALKSYKLVNEAYFKIFKDLKIPFEMAQADSGDIGGDLSQEWHYVHPNGEDLLFKCDSCNQVSNVERALSLPRDETFAKDANVRYLINDTNDTLIAVYYPSDRVFTPVSIKELIEDIDMTSLKLSNDQVVEKFINDDEDELIFKKIIRVMDIRINDQTNLPDFPLKTFQKNNFSMINDISTVEPISGEVCYDCETGHLHSMNAIEVGHTFHLGQRYSIPLDAKFVTRENKLQHYEMGCYGIGISRIIAAIAEITRDSKGLIWPRSIAPYDIAIIESNKNKVDLNDFMKVNGLDNFEIIKDERFKVGFSNRINHAKMIGIPIVLLVGQNYPIVELEIRGKRWNSQIEPAYLELYKENHTSWNWTIEDKDGFEKHHVHKDYVSKVVESLLIDL